MLARRNVSTEDYDLIVIANVLHHIKPVERQDQIGVIRKLVKDEGKVIIFEHNPVNPLTRKIVRESPLDKGVVLLPSAEPFSYLKTAGFHSIQLNYIVFFPKMFSALRWLEPLLSKFPLGAQYAIIGNV